MLRLALLFFVVAGCMGGPAFAQDPDRPLALLRQTSGTDNYVIRVQTNAKLPADTKLSAILTNKSNLITWAEEVKDCPNAQVNQFCKELESGFVVINYDLPAKPQPTDKIKVSFAISDNTGRGSFRSIDLISDFKSGGPRTDNVCGNGLIVDFKADSSSLETNPTEKEYYRSRLLALNKWLRANKSDPSRMATIHLEPLTKRAPPDPTVKNFTVDPPLDPKTPQELDVEAALGFQTVVLCLQFDEKLPTEKFNAQVVLKNNPPLELDKTLTRALSGPKAIATPIAAKIPDDNKLGLRSFDNNLELGVLFTSSVKDVKVNNKLNRQRQSRGSLDLRFAPLLRDRTRRPEAKKWQLFRTPLFFDAKVSTGKVSEDTLSLNRVLFGTEMNFRYVEGTKKGSRNKYIITLRGTNASDRDFKLVEAKGEFEFRPIFERLNQPLKTQHRSSGSVLVPDGPRIEIPSGGFFGYQIQPSIGFEGGRVYRRSRSAFKAEEQSDSVWRLMFGADMAFNLTSRFTLSLNDIFYVRGETPSHRSRNYFIGTIEAPLGNLNRNASQSLFLSFERGNQAPFASPAVNALKFGYRVRSDFFETGSAH